MANIIDYVTMPDGSLGYVLEDGTILPSGQGFKESTQPMPANNTLGTATGAALGQQAGSLVSGSSGASTVATPQVIGAGRGVGSVLSPSATPVAPSILGNFGAMGIGPQAGIVAGTLLGAKGIKDAFEGKTDNSPTGKASRLQAGITTGGLSEIGRLAGLGGGKSTFDYKKERWEKLSPELQGLYRANHPEGNNEVWETGKYKGQKWSWDKAKDLAKDDPTHLVGVLGNLETFGEQWLSTPLDKQKEVVRRLLEGNAYAPDKGDVLIHKNKKDFANQVFQEVMGNPTPTPQVGALANRPTPGSVDTIFLDDNKPNGSFKSASAPKGAMPMMNPGSLMNKPQRQPVQIPQEEVVDPFAGTLANRGASPLVNNPLSMLFR